ncbi:MAG: hypothetical protein IJI44_06700 [Erysipelotrichaceae bacterium]|nr:hypothetical protein [Erysipelotrichaceae bacterium]
MLRKLRNLFLAVAVIGVMLLLQKLYLDHHKDPVAENNVSEVLNGEQKEETVKEENLSVEKKEEPEEPENVPETKMEETEDRPVYRMLDFDRRLILNVGQQDPEICSIFCLAYGRAILDQDYEADPYDYYDGEGAVWRWAGFEDIALSDPLDTVLQRAYDEISAGRPCIFYVSDTYAFTATEKPDSRSAWQHYVLLIGYRKDADYRNLKASDFYAADPTAGYRSNDENYIPWVVLTDEAPEKTSGEYALYACQEDDRHLELCDAYADAVRWDAKPKEAVYAKRKENGSR